MDAINADAIPRELFAPDFELRNATTAMTDATYLGYEGGLEWRRDLFEGVDDARFVVDEVLATGARLRRHRQQPRRTRILVRSTRRTAVGERLFRDDNRIWRTVGFNRRRDALEAVGLSE